MSSTLKITVIAAVLLGLAACGGGGASSSSNNTGAGTTSIASITPAGFVASSTPTTLSISGSNFGSGMTVNITSSNGSANLTPTSVTSGLIVVSVPMSTVPAGNYATLSVKSASGTVLATAVFGVASVAKTLAADIQPIFNSNCTRCHDGTANFSLASGAAASSLISTTSSGCSAKVRVKAGDPQRAQSVLMDKILVASTGSAACSGAGMPADSITTLSGADIQNVREWIAGGAN